MLKCNDMYFGISTRQLRSLAYDFAVKLEINQTLGIGQKWQASNGFVDSCNAIRFETSGTNRISRTWHIGNTCRSCIRHWKYDSTVLHISTEKFKKRFVIGGPIGSSGAGNPSGWMNAEHFYEYLVHFQKYARASLENPVLLILDNHESHLSIKGLDFCKDNGIVVLSLPPHYSHKLQPLDRSVFGPFKARVNTACDNYCTSHSREPMTIYHIPAIVKDTLLHAANISNIAAGFECTGLSIQ